MSRFSKIDFNEAPTSITPTPDKWPDMDEGGCLRGGDHAFDRGLYEDALNLYSRALRFNREGSVAWVGQIRCLIEMGEYPEAVTWCDRALERFPNHPELLAGKGLAFTKMLDLQQGLEYCDGAVQLKSASAWVWLARGECLLMTKQPLANAQRCFQKALEYSESALAWRVELRIGIAFNRARNYSAARSHLFNAQRAASDNELVLFELAKAQEELGEIQLAVGLLERACSMRRFPEAADALQRVRRTNPISQWWRRVTHSN